MSIPSTNNTPDATPLNAALLLLRIASALVFLYHGSQILFGMFGGPGPAKFAAFLHMPVFTGYLVGIVQVFGGLAILTGVLIRLAALGIMAVMLGAIFLVHLPFGFDIAKGGIEYALTQLMIAAALLLAGAGDWAIKLRGN